MNASGLAADLAALHFLRPAWLWALLALPLLAMWWRSRRRRASIWREAVDPHLLQALLGKTGGRAQSAPVLIAALGWTLAVVALAGPSWRQVEQPLWQTASPLVVALDLSGTMMAADVPPSRLAQARAKVATLLAERDGGQVGLVAFADDAFTVAPLTPDAANVALFLDALHPGVMPVDGQRLDRAIAWSTGLLRQAGFDSGDILVLTDDADAAARDAAARRDVAGVGFRSPSAFYGIPRARNGESCPSDSKGFAANGGMIELFTENHRLRFLINVQSAQQAGLRISSDLYQGLRMKGVSNEFNSRARARGVVVHGAPYVSATQAGRSEGCPAMEQSRATDPVGAGA